MADDEATAESAVTTVTSRTMRRVFARKSALPAVRGDVLVNRVLLEGRTAVGVLTADGEEILARNVLVAAGAIHSPAILLRSGAPRMIYRRKSGAKSWEEVGGQFTTCVIRNANDSRWFRQRGKQ